MAFYRVILILLACAATMAEAAPPAHFVFGDSLVDSGNNNFIAMTARANMYPYGIDYPTHHPTRRFSNGYNIPDYISEKLGAPAPLPYLDPALTGNTLLRGANFASVGVGILNDTGVQFKFYELGARRVLVLSMGSLGCSPAERETRSVNGDCAPQLQQATALFNSGLRSIADQLNNQFSAQIFTMGNSFPPNKDLFTNPGAYRFSNAKNACCGQGIYNGIRPSCAQTGPLMCSGTSIIPVNVQLALLSTAYFPVRSLISTLSI